MAEEIKAQTKEVDAYIATFPEGTQKLLNQLRQAIIRSAPEAVEVISYGMPAFKYQGILVYYAGNKNHIGFYPTGSGVDVFKDEITEYKTSKGTIQFPLDRPIPVKLVKKIVKYRVKANQAKLKNKSKKTGI